jgi:L-asparagine transporter-like permease
MAVVPAAESSCSRCISDATGKQAKWNAPRQDALYFWANGQVWPETMKKIGENDMPLTTVLITLVAAGLLLWLVNRFIPMQGQIKSILNGVVVIVLVLWIANLYGIFGHLQQFRVGR